MAHLALTITQIDWQRLNIRLRGVHNGNDFCPITAVCWTLTNTYYLPRFWDKAADAIGLERMLGATIVNAADSLRVDILEPTRPEIRREMLIALGLSADEVEALVDLSAPDEEEC